MGFFAPALLFGLVAAVVPWLVHLIGKRRAVPVRFAAMQLLLRSEKRTSARRRLREILLLLSRTAIAASLPLIFARPFAERASDVPGATLLPQSAVIVLDDSASLQRRRGSGTIFDQAKARARSLLSQFPTDSDIALVLTSAHSEAPVGELSTEHARVRDALEGVKCSARVSDFTEAMRRAALILAASTRPERRIFLLTDLQAAGWGEDTGLPDQGGPDVAVIDVAGEKPWTNRAVVSLVAEPAAEAGTGGVAVTAEIASFSALPVNQLGVTLKIDGATVARHFVDVPAGGRVPKRILYSLPEGTGGTHEAEIEIDPDDFPLDDRRIARLELSRTLRALIINGDARTVKTEDEAVFLETALKIGDRTAVVTTLMPDDVPTDSLGSYTVIFAANITAPSSALAAALIRFVEGGGGLFVSVGSHVDATLWNQRMGKILPQPLGLARTASAMPGQAEGETLDNRPAERLAPLDRRHPLLAHFSASGEGLATARFFKFMLLEPVPDSIEHAVVLRFESGAPALVERQVVKGRVLLLATTVDRDWTDLPIHPGFLPLIQQSARRLTGLSEDAANPSLLVGQSRELELGADERRIEIMKPDGVLWVAHQERGVGHKTVIFNETDQPGAYHVRAIAPDGTVVPRPGDTFVVNLDPRESDPARLAADRRPDRKGRKAGTAPAAPKQRVELWHGLAALVILVVLFESLLTLRWRRSVVAENR